MTGALKVLIQVAVIVGYLIYRVKSARLISYLFLLPVPVPGVPRRSLCPMSKFLFKTPLRPIERRIARNVYFREIIVKFTARLKKVIRFYEMSNYIALFNRVVL